MNRIHFCDDLFDPECWRTDNCDDHIAAIRAEYPTWPTSARVYHKSPAIENDVTPFSEAGIEHLAQLEGDFFVVVYPEGIPIFQIIITVLTVVVSLVAAFYLANLPEQQQNLQGSSPNNQLSSRRNRARPNSRIPDIFGRVRSVPDLLSVPYRVYVEHRELETSYMCIGRGSYDVENVRDDTTDVADIPGTTVAVYGPNTSPNIGSTPQLQIGPVINEDVKTVVSSNSVNGQLLRAPNSANLTQVTGVITHPNVLTLNLSPGENIADAFEVGDAIVLANFVEDTDPDPRNFSGTYAVAAVTTNTVSFVNPGTVNPAWNTLNAGDSVSSAGPVSLSSTGSFWVGPFVIRGDDNIEIVTNFLARGGLFKQGNNQVMESVTLELEVTPIDEAGVPTGPATLHQSTVVGSATVRTQRAQTLRVQTTHSGRVRFRARRVSDTDTSFSGTVQDDIRWEELYALSDIGNIHFGNVTTLQTRTLGTAGALALRERRLNLLATRRVPVRQPNGTFSAPMATRNAADIFVAIATDPFIGRRPLTEIDVDGIYATIAEIGTYFQNPAMQEFNYTFDETEFSFEQTAAAISQAVFCTAFRQGSLIKWRFERTTTESEVLFNHRNKLPDSETRTHLFGTQNNRDGIELEWTDPTDDAKRNFILPADGSATNPRRIVTVGIRNFDQAYTHGWREFNKIRFQSHSVEFDCTQEGGIVTQRSRVLVENSTLVGAQSGEVTNQQGLILTLSQPVILSTTEENFIFLQLSDGTVQSIQISAVSGVNNQVTLMSAPRLTLVTDPSSYAMTVYSVYAGNSGQRDAFLVTDRSRSTGMQYNLRGVNYDARYYSNDQDRATT